jgi:hypothetical protein
MTDNKNKQMTKKEIRDLAAELMKEMNKTDLEMEINLDKRQLGKLSNQVVAKLSQLRELVTFHDKLYNMTQVDWDYINMTEQEELLGELAKLMTLMNIFTDKEEYEKCSLLKARIKDIKRKLKKIENDEM